MKMLVMSDSHGQLQLVKDILNKYEYDYSFDLGDSLLEEEQIASLFTHYVEGNVDYWNKDNEFEKFVNLENKKIGYVHGHTVGNGYDDGLENYYNNLFQFAKKHQLNILFFGHSHVPYHETRDNITIINPGSITEPRSPKGKTFAIVQLFLDSDKIKVEFINVE